MLRLIAAFKLVKGVLLLTVGVGVLRLLRRATADSLGAWTTQLHLDPGNRLGHLLEKVGSVDERTLQRISVGMLVYAVLLLIEGTGLMLRQRWAEYFTVIITVSFIPLEVYEAVRHLTATRVLIIAINLAIVGYLITRLKRGGEGGRDARPGSEGTMTRRRAYLVVLLLTTSPAWADEAEQMAMTRVRLSTEPAAASGCVRLGQVMDDSINDLRRKIVRAGGDTGILWFGVEDEIYAQVFRCASAGVMPAAPTVVPGIPAPPPGSPPPPPPSLPR